MLKTDAWRHLSCLARAAYVEMAAAYTGGNNGRIIFSARELAERLGASKSTASRAINELEDHGFIVTMRHSSFTLKLKLAAEYRLTAIRCDVTSNPPTKGFTTWQPKIQSSVASVKPSGLTHETVNQKRRRKQAEQFH